MSHLGVHCIGEIDRCGSLGELLDVSTGCEDEDLIEIEIEFEVGQGQKGPCANNVVPI